MGRAGTPGAGHRNLDRKVNQGSWKKKTWENFRSSEEGKAYLAKLVRFQLVAIQDGHGGGGGEGGGGEGAGSAEDTLEDGGRGEDVLQDGGHGEDVLPGSGDMHGGGDVEMEMLEGGGGAEDALEDGGRGEDGGHGPDDLRFGINLFS